MDTKRIFVLGNGFDLAHYLPTAYVHFMDAMMVVESCKEDQELGFDDLFQKYIEGECSDREKNFFSKTKELYRTDDLRLSVEIVKVLQEKLINNGWFQHFKHHLTDVDTWIDFENEIENILTSFSSIFDIEFSGSTVSDSIVGSYTNPSPDVDIRKVLDSDEQVFDWRIFKKFGVKLNYFLNLLNNFNVIKRIYGCAEYEIESQRGRQSIYKNQVSKRLNKLEYDSFDAFENKKIDEITTRTTIKKSFENIVEIKYLNRLSTIYTSFNENEVFNKALKDLELFSEIFTTYIGLVVNQLETVESFCAFGNLGQEIEALYTFNYSNTFEKLYPSSFDKEYNHVQYIHGSAERKNIVLGISDLDEHQLKKYKIYGFVKAFQKLINNTDYKFLDNTDIKVARSIPREAGQVRAHYEVVIWGHSLDASDAEYIREIFSLNHAALLNRVTIKIWYHSSPHMQLANLMYIMGKDVIQEWMKKGWLVFEAAPDIYAENKKTE